MQDLKLILHRFASNIIFSNGLRDPYSSGGYSKYFLQKPLFAFFLISNLFQLTSFMLSMNLRVLESISNSVVAVTTANGTLSSLYHI